MYESAHDDLLRPTRLGKLFHLVGDVCRGAQGHPEVQRGACNRRKQFNVSRWKRGARSEFEFDGYEGLRDGQQN